MLGLGWSEMLVIGIVILIVVGPKDLPVMMRNIGRMMGTVRRMSNEFRREIDKAIAVDEIREAKKAISDPLRQTSQDISREFNALKNGKVEPSGKLAPAEPGKESVVDEIRTQAGMPPVPMAQISPAAAALRAKVSETVSKPTDALTTAVESAEPVAAKPKVKAAPRNAATSTAERKTAKPAAKAPRAKAAKSSGAKTDTEATEVKAVGPTTARKTSTKKTTAKKADPARTKSAADAESEG